MNQFPCASECPRGQQILRCARSRECQQAACDGPQIEPGTDTTANAWHALPSRCRQGTRRKEHAPCQSKTFLDWDRSREERMRMAYQELLARCHCKRRVLRIARLDCTAAANPCQAQHPQDSLDVQTWDRSQMLQRHWRSSTVWHGKGCRTDLVDVSARKTSVYQPRGTPLPARLGAVSRAPRPQYGAVP